MDFRSRLAGLQVFEVAARHGNFSAAADELNVTPSAVSHRIANLESDFGFRLFRRGRQGLALTERGAALAERLGAALELIGVAVEEARTGVAHGTLTIHCAPSFASKWLVRRLNDFISIAPEFRISIESAYSASPLRTDYDVAVVYGMPTESGLTVVPLIEETVQPLCRPGLVGDEPSGLAGHALIHARNRLQWPAWLQRHGLEDVAVGHQLWMENSAIAIDAAVRGLGVVLESDFLAAEELEEGRLIAPFGPSFAAPPRAAYFLAYPEVRAQAPGVRAFVKWIFEATGENPA